MHRPTRRLELFCIGIHIIHADVPHPVRMRSLRFRDTEHAEQGLAWPRRSRARLRVQPRYGGKRWTFSDLRPATAATITGHVRAGLPRAGR